MKRAKTSLGDQMSSVSLKDLKQGPEAADLFNLLPQAVLHRIIDKPLSILCLWVYYCYFPSDTDQISQQVYAFVSKNSEKLFPVDEFMFLVLVMPRICTSREGELPHSLKLGPSITWSSTRSKSSLGFKNLAFTDLYRFRNLKEFNKQDILNRLLI